MLFTLKLCSLINGKKTKNSFGKITLQNKEILEMFNVVPLYGKIHALMNEYSDRYKKSVVITLRWNLKFPYFTFSADQKFITSLYYSHVYWLVEYLVYHTIKKIFTKFQQDKALKRHLASIQTSRLIVIGSVAAKVCFFIGMSISNKSACKQFFRRKFHNGLG